MYPYRSKDTPLHHPLVSRQNCEILYYTAMQVFTSFLFKKTEGALFLFSETAVRLLFFSVPTTASPPPPVWLQAEKTT